MDNEDTTKDSISYKIRKQILGRFGTILGLVILVIVFSVLSPAFLTSGNIKDILIQSGTNAVIAAGMTFIIISGEIDLSVGSVVALSSVIGATVMVNTNNVVIGVLVALIIGTVLGFLNGVISAYGGFASFIVTLSTMWLFRGVAYVYTGGIAVVDLPVANMNLAIGNTLFLPNIVWLIIITYLICYVVLTKTTFGRKIYAIGDNREAARLSGINVKKMKLFAFAISGFLAALSGVILMSRLNSGQPIAGASFEMTAIASAVIGGASISKGGIGSVVGTLIGAIFIATLLNGLVILNVSSFWQQVVMGIVVLGAVAVDKYRKRLT